MDFGICHVESHRTSHFYLTNETKVTAKWKLEAVKFPKKAIHGHNTTTPYEIENKEKTDDPDVFEFTQTSGTLKGKSLALWKIPQGGFQSPVPKTAAEREYLPITI